NIHDKDMRHQQNHSIMQYNPFKDNIFGFVLLSACSSKDEQRRKSRRIRCLKQVDRRQVDVSFCLGNKPAPITANCNSKCKLSWEKTWESECSSSCGLGEKTRTIKCIKMPKGRTSGIIVGNGNCSHLQKPPQRVVCDGQCRQRTKWIYSRWSECSRSCGQGTQRRSAYCSDGNRCDTSSRVVVQTCNVGPCANWVVLDWSSCSVSCGSGIQSRNVACMYSDNQETSGNECNIIDKPDEEKSCHQSCRSKWISAPWGECSKTCGGGIQERLVRCQDEDRTCDEQTKPSTTQKCNNEPCATWNYGEWGECSHSCDGGHKSRAIACVAEDGRTIDMNKCDPRQIPADKMLCNTHA
ncbi:A disintegrin and metalloproteinase with thrombospondin motifs 9-like, partial [Anneissia japonica]|uniref:A disintegrin and metalloproteinase with thrombospondin motifs 9-like n=1 Tax=Anneissia japonica TaxID=1529436 RepID=UPI001425A524